jgi:NodT family efflux transporter outer membrane factor (OMF) lipoprotein
MRSAALALVTALVAWSPVLAQDAGRVEPIRTTFWKTLGDSTLERLIGRALQANRDLLAVEARVNEARAIRVEAALDLAPRVTASAGYSRQRLASASFPGAGGRLPDQNVWDAGLQMSWEIDVFGRLRRSLRGQNQLLAAAEEDVRDVQVLLAAEVARTYFDMRGAQDRLFVARRNAENQRSTLVLTQDRLELGRGNALDTERAQAQLSSTLASIPAIEAEVAALQHRIGVLIGASPGALREELGEIPCPPELPEQLSVANAGEIVRQRPDVLSAGRLLDARRSFVDAAKADYLPRVSIGAVAGYTANDFDALGNSGTPRYAIGPVISWPFLDLGRVKSRVNAARAGEAQAVARYEQTLLNAQEEAETALSTYRGARARLVHLEDAAAASERAVALARLRFDGGATGFLEVLDAERTLLDAQDRLAQGRREATNALVAVYRSLGGNVQTLTGQ